MISLCIGIDVGKASHVAGFLSHDLLIRYGRFERCPHLSFPQSQAGLQTLLEHIHAHGTTETEVAVLLEETGHYHRPLEEALLARGVTVYSIAARQKKAVGLDKTDRIDALRLANHLFGQLVLGQQIADRSQMIRRRLPPTEAAARCVTLVQRRYELVRDCVRCRNRLTAIADEIFPEFRLIFRDVNGGMARLVRKRWPTPAVLCAQATLTELKALRLHTHPGEAKLAELLRFAENSIGIRDPMRLHGLLLEQRQLLELLEIQERQLAELEAELDAIVRHAREGQILLSIMPIGPIHAATLLGAIGTIDNFQSAAALRKFCGWAPQRAQTGSSYDLVYQTRVGGRLLRQVFFLLAMSAVHMDGEWRALYERLVPLKCSFDPKSKTYKGKRRVLGRIAGQMIGVIYTLLSNDSRLLREASARGEPPPPPVLYDAELHRMHRHGHARFKAVPPVVE